jgi:hypothetical protein
MNYSHPLSCEYKGQCRTILPVLLLGYTRYIYSNNYAAAKQGRHKISNCWRKVPCLILCREIAKQCFQIMNLSLYNDCRELITNSIECGRKQPLPNFRYYPKGREFDSRWGHWIFQLTQSFQPHCGPGIGSVSNRNECQESSWWGKGRPARKADNHTTIYEPIV